MSTGTTTAGTYRPPRARILRGTVIVTHTLNLSIPSWHLDPLCGGLENVETERRGVREFADAWALAEDVGGRICRMCALESLLRTIMRPVAGEPGRYVTFSSRPPGKSSGGATASGEARLRRLAKTLGLETTSTASSGVIAYGTVPARAVDALGANLDTLTIPWVRSTPPSEHVQCFWILADDHTGPLNAAVRRDLWTTARLLTC